MIQDFWSMWVTDLNSSDPLVIIIHNHQAHVNADEPRYNRACPISVGQECKSLKEQCMINTIIESEVRLLKTDLWGCIWHYFQFDCCDSDSFILMYMLLVINRSVLSVDHAAQSTNLLIAQHRLHGGDI